MRFVLYKIMQGVSKILIFIIVGDNSWFEDDDEHEIVLFDDFKANGNLLLLTFDDVPVHGAALLINKKNNGIYIEK